jgi:hypothetical protein
MLNPNNRNYYHVVVKSSNSSTVSQFINVPFKCNKVKVVSSYYNVDSTDASVEEIYYVRSNLVEDQILSVLSFGNSNKGFTFDINPNLNISNFFNFTIYNSTNEETTLAGHWSILIQFQSL